MNALALRRSFVAAFVLLVATSASAVVSSGSVSILIDADRNAVTGCNVTAGQVTYAGIEFVVKTAFDAMVVTGVTKQQCVNGVLGGPVTIDTGGWNVGTAAGTLYLETSFPVSLLGGPIQQARYVFVGESGTFTDVVDSINGAPIIFPPDGGPGRHRVVVPPSVLSIILDGNIIDWGDLLPLVADAAGTGIPAFRISNVYLLFSRGKFFFRFDLEVNASAPIAQADSYSVLSNGALNQPASSGVLANDFNPPGNGAMTAVKLSDPLHGTLTLNPDGSFTYLNNGSSAVSDSFTYKAHNSAGDSNTVTVSITIIQGNAPSITSANATTFKVGVAGNFLVTTSGTPQPSLTRSGSALPTGVSFINNGNGTATLSGTPAAGTGGTYIFLITASNIAGSANQTFTLTVQEAPAITTAAANQTVCPGATATFTAAASGFPAPSVQWRVSTNGGATFTDIPGATSTTLSFTANAADNGNLYRAVFTNSLGTAQTTGTLTVNSGPPVTTTNPANQTVCAGANASFTAAASGTPAPTIQWQVSSGGPFTDIPGATSGTLTFATTAADDGKQYHAVFTNSCGTVTTTPATLTVNTAPAVTTNPVAQTACDGTSVSFSAASSGSPAPTVQWQVSSGGPFADIPGANSATLTFTATSADNGKQYHAVFTNSCGTATTTAAVLNVTTAPAVTNPVDQTACAGSSATFTAASSPAANVQWQVSSGGPFTNIPGATSTTLSFITSPGENGNRYQAVFTNSCGTATTTSALLTVFVAPAVTAEPTNQTACDGASVSFTSTGGGTAPTVQWQVSSGGGPFTDIPFATSTTLTFNAAAAQNGNLYHAVFTNSCGTATSANASLTVNTPPAVTTNPLTPQPVCNGSSVSFIAAASGSPAPTVQWQISTDAGVSFTDISGETSGTYTFTAALTDNGHQYRAVFTNSCSPPATTTAATLTVDDTLAVNTQPTDQTVCTPNSATFTAAASGPATVQWQVSSGGPFSDIPGATSTTLTFTPVLADNGKQYHAVFTNACSSATTNAATLTVHAPPAVTTQPTNQTVCNGATATFTAAASGTPAPTVQWQVSSGGPFSDIPGATTTTLTFTATSADNGKQYHAVFTNSCSTATTNAATLTVPTVVISPAAGALTAAIYHAGYSQTFTASGGTAPYTYAISPLTPPAGLSFNTSTGVLSGSAPTLPDNTGNFSFSISATDSNGCQHSQSYTLEVKPGANNDTYSNVVGNTQAWVSGGTTTQPATPAYTLTGSVLANDVAPFGATASAGGTTTNGGSVALASDGTFLYTPPVGTITNDTFTYTITSNGATNTAVVTIQFNNRVWWVKNNAAAGDGRSNTPGTLSNAGSSSFVNDIIFVYAGDGTTTNQNSGITLKNNQLLTGEALALMVNGQTLVAAGATPLIGNSGGAVITVANDDFIQGLNITTVTVNTAGISVGVGVTGTTSIGTVSITASSSASGVFIAGGSSNLTWTNGGITISAGGSAGAGVNAIGGSGNITLTNVPINVNAGGTGATGAIAIAIASKSGGGLTLTGGSTVTAGTASSRQIVSPIQITNSAGTYSFANKLAVFTSSATAFSASNSGTLTVTDATSTLDSSNGTALNVTNTTIGASGLTFQSISSNGGSNNGIILSTTGSSGGLTVTGTGSPASGGTIANKTGADGSTTQGTGIFLNSTSAVSLSRMQLNDFQNFGIRGIAVNGFILANSIINATGAAKNGNSDAANEASMKFGTDDLVTNGLTGVASITNSTIEDGFENNFEIYNHSGSLTLTITGCTFQDTSTVSPGNAGFRLQTDGTANATGTITTSTFARNRARGIQLINQGSGAMDIDIGAAGTVNSGGTFTDNGIAVDIDENGSGTTNFNVLNASFTSAGYAALFGAGGAGSPINIAMGGAASPVERGAFTGNIMGNTINNSASGTGPGIEIVANGTDNTGGNTLTIKVDGNSVTNVANFGVHILSGDGNATVNATVSNNTVSTVTNAALQALRVDAGATSSQAGAPGTPDNGTVNLDSHGNTLSADPLAGVTAIRIRQRFNTTFRLEGYLGSATDDAAVQTYTSGQNGGASAAADHSSTGFQNIGSVPEPPLP